MKLEAKEIEQIKKASTRMWKVIFFLFVCICAYILHRCNNSDAFITIPEKTGSFKPAKVNNTPITEIRYKTIFKKSNDIFLQSQIDSLILINESLERSFAELPVNKKDSVYKKAIEINSFEKTFEDSLVKITINGLARGTVESLSTDYVIKEQKAPIKQRLKFFAGAGAGAGINKELSQGVIKANLGVITKKDNIIQLSYMQVGQNQFGVVEYNIKMF